MIANDPFFDQPVKNKQKVFEKFDKMSKNNDYTKGNILDNCTMKIIIKILTEVCEDKQIQLFLNKLHLGKLEQDDEATIFFIAEKQQNNGSKLFFSFISHGILI